MRTERVGPPSRSLVVYHRGGGWWPNTVGAYICSQRNVLAVALVPRLLFFSKFPVTLPIFELQFDAFFVVVKVFMFFVIFVLILKIFN